MKENRAACRGIEPRAIERGCPIKLDSASDSFNRAAEHLDRNGAAGEGAKEQSACFNDQPFRGRVAGQQHARGSDGAAGEDAQLRVRADKRERAGRRKPARVQHLRFEGW